MIKKIIAVAMSLAAFSCSAYADKNESLVTNTVRVNIAADTMTLNDEPVETVSKTYVTDDGVTMTEFFTLTGLLGAEVTENDNVFTVTYEGVEMIYTLGAEKADIAGQTIPMPKALLRSGESVVMAPLRFVSEALGADVTYDKTVGEIVITSSGIDEGINFKLLFKYASKSKVGNSDEHWRFSKTDNFDMSDNMWAGGYQFSMDDMFFTLDAVKNENDLTVDHVYAELQSDNSQYSYMSVMYDKGRGEQNGVPYAYAKVRTIDTISEFYGYVTDEFVYYISIERTFEQFSGSKDNIDVNTFLDSLEFDYNGTDEDDTVDLADINPIESEDEFSNEYTDGNYSWSVKLSDGWTVEEYYGFYNVVNITRQSDLNDDYGYNEFESEYSYVYPAIIYVTTLSNSENQSTTAWANERKTLIEQTVSPSMRTVSELTDTTVGGLEAKTFDFSLTHGEDTDVYNLYFINYGYYRYELVLIYDKRDGEQAGFLESATDIIRSFTPKEINQDEIGDALEADSELDMLKLTAPTHCGGFTVSLPVSWYATKNGSGVYISDYEHYNSSDYGSTPIYPELMMLSQTTDKLVSISRNSTEYYDGNLNKRYYTAEEYLKNTLLKMLNVSDSEITASLENAPVAAGVMNLDGYSAELLFKSESYGKTYVDLYCLPSAENEVILISKLCHESIKGTVYETVMDNIIKSAK